MFLGKYLFSTNFYFFPRNILLKFLCNYLKKKRYMFLQYKLRFVNIDIFLFHMFNE